jgi:hypothetical protein
MVAWIRVNSSNIVWRAVWACDDEFAPVARQSRWWTCCLIQKCSRTVRALPHQDAPVTASLWQSVPDGKQRLPPKRSHRLGAGPGPACPGGGSARPAFLFDRRACFPVPTWRRQSRSAQRRGWEERSHPEPRAARSFARAWRGWRAPDLPRSEHRGTLRTSRRARPPRFYLEALRHETRA